MFWNNGWGSGREGLCLLIIHYGFILNYSGDTILSFFIAGLVT